VAHLLGAERLRLEYPTRVVFDGVTVGVSEGDRIGVVGRNGDGKSTLLSLLAGRLEPDDGRVTSRRGVTIGMLDQGDVLDPGLTVSAAIVGDRADHEWAGDSRIRDVIAGLVSDIAWDATLSTLSGGQQRRVALAPLDQRADHLAGLALVLLVDQPPARERAPQHLGIVPAEERLGLARPAHDTQRRVPLDHRQRRIVEVR
jgi:ATPase subunit of ABC transporter with duplicated ATPase domains